MVCEFPFRQSGCQKDDTGRINLRMDLTFDVPSNIAEQLRCGAFTASMIASMTLNGRCFG